MLVTACVTSSVWWFVIFYQVASHWVQRRNHNNNNQSTDGDHPPGMAINLDLQQHGAGSLQDRATPALDAANAAAAAAAAAAANKRRGSGISGARTIEDAGAGPAVMEPGSAAAISASGVHAGGTSLSRGSGSSGGSGGSGAPAQAAATAAATVPAVEQAEPFEPFKVDWDRQRAMYAYAVGFQGWFGHWYVVIACACTCLLACACAVFSERVLHCVLSVCVGDCLEIL